MVVGKRVDHRIEILSTAEIACSHAMGPGFLLTAEEIAGAIGGLEPADGLLRDFDVVGCYWSKPNGRLTLTDNDLALFSALCPGRWQTALIIRPTLGGVTMAAFGMRVRGNHFTLGVPHELVWREAAEPTEVQEIAEVPVSAPESVPEELVRNEEVLATMPGSETLFGVPMQPYVPGSRSKWGTRLFAIVVMVAVALAAVFFARGIR
jgi:hypothetical protein